MVNTVLGAIDPSQMGVTLPHEHIFANMMREQRIGGLLNDYELMVSEVRAFKDIGGSTIWDLTPTELTYGAAPDPGGRFTKGHRADLADGSRSANHILSVMALSRETGVNIVAGTGHYRDPFLDKEWFDQHSVAEIAELMVREIEDGIAGTEARAGIIGEIGSNNWYISSAEERSFRAAAKAQQASGLALSTHANRWPVGIDQLDLLEECGVDPRRVIVGHCDNTNLLDYHLALARRGTYVQFDNLFFKTSYDLEKRVGFVVNLIRAGFIDQILLSHDTCKRNHLRVEGGNGYCGIHYVFRPALQEAGVSKEEVDHIMTDNPRRALVPA